nr:hypothetical protein CFP56_00153 [Quercus suber]
MQAHDGGKWIDKGVGRGENAGVMVRGRDGGPVFANQVQRQARLQIHRYSHRKHKRSKPRTEEMSLKWYFDSLMHRLLLQVGPAPSSASSTPGGGKEERLNRPIASCPPSMMVLPDLA